MVKKAQTTKNGYVTFEPNVFDVYTIVTKYEKCIVSKEALAKRYAPGRSLKTAERKIREILNIQHKEPLFRKIIIMTPKGAFVASKQEAKDYIKRIKSQALDLLEVVSSLEKKIELHGQYQLQDTPNKRPFITTLAEDRK